MEPQIVIEQIDMSQLTELTSRLINFLAFSLNGAVVSTG